MSVFYLFLLPIVENLPEKVNPKKPLTGKIKGGDYKLPIDRRCVSKIAQSQKILHHGRSPAHTKRGSGDSQQKKFRLIFLKRTNPAQSNSFEPFFYYQDLNPRL